MSEKARRYASPLPPVLFLTTVGAGALADRIWPAGRGIYSEAAGLAAGMAIFFGAGVLGLWAIIEMTRLRTPIHPGRVPNVLVTSGPFAITRNPLYVTLLLTALAIAIMVRSIWLLSAAVVLFALLDRLVVAREERAIRDEFGAEYDRYAARVRRWL